VSQLDVGVPEQIFHALWFANVTKVVIVKRVYKGGNAGASVVMPILFEIQIHVQYNSIPENGLSIK